MDVQIDEKAAASRSNLSEGAVVGEKRQVLRLERKKNTRRPVVSLYLLASRGSDSLGSLTGHSIAVQQLFSSYSTFFHENSLNRILVAPYRVTLYENTRKVRWAISKSLGIEFLLSENDALNEHVPLRYSRRCCCKLKPFSANECTCARFNAIPRN